MLRAMVASDLGSRSLTQSNTEVKFGVSEKEQASRGAIYSGKHAFLYMRVQG